VPPGGAEAARELTRVTIPAYQTGNAVSEPDSPAIPNLTNILQTVQLCTPS